MERKEYCTSCREFNEYDIKTERRSQIMKGKEYFYNIDVLYCKNCGEEIDVVGGFEKEIELFDKAYRQTENIISIKKIKDICELYDVGKAPLSLVLGFGEVTITRYLEGQIPSKGYSDILNKVLADPYYMEELLNENRSKISNAAATKIEKAINELKKVVKLSIKLRATIAAIFDRIEVTPLALQKILYFIQSIHLGRYNKPIFNEDCEAWAHGPVYREVYDIFKTFKYNPIDDSRFTMLTNIEDELSKEEIEIINLVLDSYGCYSAKVLEIITHNEEPWINTRKGLDEMQPSSRIISKDLMRNYYKSVEEKEPFITKQNIYNYISKKTGISI